MNKRFSHFTFTGKGEAFHGLLFCNKLHFRGRHFKKVCSLAKPKIPGSYGLYLCSKIPMCDKIHTSSDVHWYGRFISLFEIGKGSSIDQKPKNQDFPDRDFRISVHCVAIGDLRAPYTRNFRPLVTML